MAESETQDHGFHLNTTDIVSVFSSKALMGGVTVLAGIDAREIQKRKQEPIGSLGFSTCRCKITPRVVKGVRTGGRFQKQASVFKGSA